ncbi:hypothetical protein A1QM_08675 [Vibrio genomosp. F10 str. 9ZC157]|nr:hypothetical protein A1QM_08675 [Vibrio genomosp. F10 str. 9ZC157]
MIAVSLAAINEKEKEKERKREREKETQNNIIKQVTYKKSPLKMRSFRSISTLPSLLHYCEIYAVDKEEKL